MVINRLQSFLSACFFLLISLCAGAQDNLSTSFTPPDFLNICGDADESAVNISLNGLSSTTRSGIQATAHLFQGVVFEALNTAATTAGVTLVDGSDPNNPVFSLPDMSPTGVSSVDIVFSVRANCGYTDTLAANDLLEAYDTWEFLYDMGSTTGIWESDGDFNNSYRNAFAVPFVTMSVPNTLGPYRVGECLTRTITASNSGLNGFIDTLIYTNVQEPGVVVNEVVVNGDAIPVIKGVNANGDTVISATIAGIFFAGNTIGAGAGNGDQFLDPDETVTIVEQLCVISCVDGRQSDHRITWGCDGNNCDIDQQSSLIRIGNGAANVSIAESGSVPSVNVGYCQTGQRIFTISNDGVDIDPGYGAMMNLELGVVFGADVLLEGNFEITGIRISGQDIVSPVAYNALDGNPLFSSDPDGAGGLDDVDGDGFFDDLPVNASVEIIGFYDFMCSNAMDVADNCVNNFNATLKTRARYTDACSDQTTFPFVSQTGPGNSNSFLENCTTPDAFLNVDTFYINHEQERQIRFFDRNCGGSDILDVRVVLPMGVNPVLSHTNLSIGSLSNTVPLLGNNMEGDTLVLTYDASAMAEINGRYFLDLAFSADCSALPGPSVLHTEISYYCPSCDCRHLWYCEDIAGPQLHASNPPCSPAVVPVCNVGVQTTDFEVNRTTLGYTDNSYTTPVSPDVANTKIALSCDTVEMKVSNVVGNTALTDSIGVVITYSNADRSTNEAETFLFSGATVRIVQGATEQFCFLTPADTLLLIQDSLKTIRFNLNNCLTSLGLTLNPGDSIEFTGQFLVNPDGPYFFSFAKVPDLRAYTYAVVDGQEYACDNFGDVLEIARNQTNFDYPRGSGTSNLFPRGCAETFMDYRLVTSIDGFGPNFPNEFRAAASVDSIRFRFDPAILEAFEVFSPMVSIPGHPVYGNDFYPMPPFEDFPDGNYVARFDTLSYKPSFNVGVPYPFTFRIRVVPDCNSPNASSNNNNIYDFDPTIHFTDNYFAREFGDGSCAKDTVITQDNDLIYSAAPTFTFNAISNSNYTLLADTAEWILQHCNTSFNADAGASWLAIDSPDGAVEIIQIDDISDPNNPVSLPFNGYGNTGDSVFAFTPQLLRADGSNTQVDYCNTLRIKALVQQCGASNFTARVGWNCIPYTDSLWTPEWYPPCSDDVLTLSVTTQDPFLDAVISDIPASNPDLCDTVYVTILVENTDVGAAYNVKSQLILPLQGASFVPGSVGIAYPSGASFAPASADPVLMGTNQRGQIYQYDDFSALDSYLEQNGLPGFDNTSPSDSNAFKIRFGFVTDCNYRSGSFAYYNFQGVKGCQDSTNVDAGESQPIYLNGAEPNPNKSFSIAFNGSQLINSGGNSTLEMVITNLTNTATDASDLVSIKIPLSLNYIPGSSVAVIPGSWGITDPVEVTVGDVRMLSWNLPVGLLQNEQAVFRFDLSAPDFACDLSSVDLSLATLTSNTVFCDNSGTSCTIETVSSINGEQIIPVDIGQSLLNYGASSITSSCLNATQEEITVAGFITNSNRSFPSQPFSVRYYHDADGNGAYDATDPEMASFTENGPLAANEMLAFSHSFPATAIESCALIARIDSTGLGLCEIEEELLGPVQLLNAGQDTALCSNTPTTLSLNLGDSNCGTMTSYSYAWTALAPADISDLSDPNVADPLLTLNHNGMTQDTLYYILTTTRPGCAGTTVDTVRLIRAIGVSIDPGSTVFVEAGDSAVLMPTISGGIGPLTYHWSPATGLDDPSVANPTVRPSVDTDYVLQVSNASGCVAAVTVPVRIGSGCSPATVKSITITEPACGTSDGSAAINLVEDESNYNFQWTPDVGTPIGAGQTRTGLSFGAYEVVITEVNHTSCTKRIEFFIENNDGPQASILSTTPASCTAADGSASLSPIAFNYQWSDGGVGSDRSDLPSGSYSVTYSDPVNVSCQNVIEVVIEETNALSASVQVNAYPQCGQNDGSVTLNVNGGSGSYAYSWASGTDTQTGLGAGIYTVTISELGGSGCELELVFSLRNNAELSPISIAVDPVPISCGGDANGWVDFTVSYDNSFSGPADTIISNGVDQFENGNLIPGDYCLYIQDAGNCITGEACFNVAEPDSLYLLIIKTDACGTGGDIEVQAEGGNEPYTIDWADLVGADDPALRSSLTEGDYFLELTDQNGCLIDEVVTIDPCICEPADLISISIIEPDCGLSNGSVSIKLEQSESDYSFSWSPDLGTSSVTGNIRGDLPFGQYRVTISKTGADACDRVIDFLVQNSDGPVAALDAVGPATCAAADGFARLSPAGYDYSWSDGGTGPERSNLFAGTYLVTFSDPADPTCQNILEVEVASVNPLQASVQINNAPACGLSDGSVTLLVSGGSGSYNFSWPSGSDTQTGLSGGPVQVVISDNGGDGCVLDFNFVLPNLNTATVGLDSDTVSVSCAGAMDGLVNYTVNYEPGFVAPADTLIVNTDGSVQNGSLLPGNYCLYIEDDNNCVTGGACFTVKTPDSLYLVFVIETSCDTMGSIAVGVEGGTAPFVYDWADLPGTDDIRDRNNLAEAGYSLLVRDSLGCEIIDDYIYVPACADSCEYFYGVDTLSADGCSGWAQVCVDILLPDTAQYQFRVDGNPYNGNFGSCFETSGAYSYAELFGQGNLGPYELLSWRVSNEDFSGAFNDIRGLLDSMNSWDPDGNWTLNETLLVIEGGNPANSYGSIETLQPQVNAPSTLAYNSRLVPNGLYLEIEEGEHLIEITALQTGCSGQMLAQVLCRRMEDVIDTIFITEVVTHCLDTSRLDLSAEVASVTNLCPSTSGIVRFSIDTAVLCVSYEGVKLGSDTACIEVCDILGNCDTLNYYITVLNLPPDIVSDTIFVNQTINYCLDTSIFAGNIERFENFCPGETSGVVEFFLNPETYCVEYTGLTFGAKDTACVLICDDLGFCDTTYFCIFVDEYLDLPLAVDDYDTTAIGTPVVINIKENDITFGGIDTAYLLTTPQYGTAILNPDCSVTYNPSDEFCEREDMFSYVICNPNGCDTAEVFVFIECIDITVFNAVSPNRDGNNDVFFISGIEDYPDSELFIYNRWGTQVYNTRAYKNDWRGTWKNNRDLPDGTYYYMLELNDNEKRVFSGFIQLHR